MSDGVFRLMVMVPFVLSLSLAIFAQRTWTRRKIRGKAPRSPSVGNSSLS